MTAALPRERTIVLGALVLLIAVAWGLLVGYADGLHMAAMPMPGLSGWAVFSGAFVMWALMMVAMMTPSAVPMILLHARVAARSDAAGAARMSLAFTAAYLVLWIVFALAATLAQLVLVRLHVIDDMLAMSSQRIAGLVLIAAGLYQFTPLKHACLAGCRGPVDFLSRHWHPGVGGAFCTGLEHGLFCLGCCWALMLLLFVGGVMNFVWIAALTALVVVEKLAPGGDFLARAAGAGLVGWGAWLAVAGRVVDS